MRHVQAIHGLAQDMWLRMESEAELTWSGLSEYRTALEESARSSDEMRVNGHQEVGPSLIWNPAGEMLPVSRWHKLLEGPVLVSDLKNGWRLCSCCSKINIQIAGSEVNHRNDTPQMQSRFIASFAGLAALVVTLATIVVSYNAVAPVAALGNEIEVVDIPTGMERTGPEFLSSNPQMQILTCFGTCGAACMVSSADTLSLVGPLWLSGVRHGRCDPSRCRAKTTK